MQLQCIFILSECGEVMVEKQTKTGHHVERGICAWFWEHKMKMQMEVAVVVTSPTHYLFPLRRDGDGVVFLGCSQLELPPLLAFEFLSRLAHVLSDYLAGGGAAPLTDDLIKDNFVIVYEILDEMMDNGFPLTTELNLLKDLVLPPTVVSKVFNAVTGLGPTLPSSLAAASTVPWRTSLPKSTANHLYVNLVEQLDACISRDGNLRRCQVYGEIQVNSSLPGFPDFTLSFTNPSLLNDVRFHPCVRFRPWESSQLLSFIPPDGHFKLISYRFLLFHYKSNPHLSF